MKVGERNLLNTNKEKLENENKEIEKELLLISQSKKLLELFVRSTEHRIKNYIEPIVTEALDFVFSQSLFFHLYLVTRRNQIECDFIIIRSDEFEKMYEEFLQDPIKNEKQLDVLVKETKNINYMYGGAVNQVVSLILRFVLAELLKVKGPIGLDEPSSMVGEEYSSRLGQLISSLSNRFQRQYILITHSKTLASFADKTYEVEKINNVSVVKEMKE
jgi:DNA repair exonuclease SbcCD ATPase subunit